MSLSLEDYPDIEVADELACLSTLADAWTLATIWSDDPWHAWVVAAVLRPAIARAFRGVTVH